MCNDNLREKQTRTIDDVHCTHTHTRVKPLHPCVMHEKCTADDVYALDFTALLHKFNYGPSLCWPLCRYYGLFVAFIGFTFRMIWFFLACHSVQRTAYTWPLVSIGINEIYSEQTQGYYDGSLTSLHVHYILHISIVRCGQQCMPEIFVRDSELSNYLIRKIIWWRSRYDGYTIQESNAYLYV